MTSFRRPSGLWSSKIVIKGEQIWLGSFETREEADSAYKWAKDHRNLFQPGEGWTSSPLVFLKPTRELAVAYCEAMRFDPCAYCGARPAGHLDHIEPRERRYWKDRKLYWENLAGVCQSCNSSKHRHRLINYLAIQRYRSAIVEETTTLEALASLEVPMREPDTRSWVKAEHPAADDQSVADAGKQGASSAPKSEGSSLA